MAGISVLQIGKFYPPHKGGMESNLRLLSEGLKPSIEVSVLVSSDGRRRVHELVGGVPVTRAATWFQFSSAPICPGMVREIRESGADLVHLHLPNPPAMLAYLASGRRGSVVATYHSDIIAQKVLGAALKPFLQGFLDRCSAIIATSQNYVDSSPILSRRREQCRVIPHGIPWARYQAAPPEATARIRSRHGQRLVLSVGRMSYYKGFGCLLQAMRSVEARLLLIGDGPLRTGLERQARELGIADRVDFLGEVDDIIPYYHAADVFVLASTHRSEAFGIVQLEAMACGKPVVNTRLDSGVPFVSVHRRTGITVPPADPAALAAAVNELLDKPALREEYGQAGRRRVREEFSLEGMVSGTLALYQDALGGRGGP